MRLSRLIAASTLVCLAACGGSDSKPMPPTPVASYSVGGTLGGLQGSGLVILNNGGDALSVPANGTGFTFPAEVASGNPFNVTVMTQPANPSQTCMVAHGSGFVTGNDITNVAVTCTTNAYTVGGTVSGLTGTGLTLTDKLGGTVAVAISGQFTLPNSLPSGTPYEVSVATDPATPPQGCSVSHATGTIAGNPITNVTVTCNNATEQLLVTDGVNLINYFIDPETGSVAAGSSSSRALGAGFTGMTTDPTGTFVYASFRTPPATANDIEAFAVTPTGALTSIAGSPFPVGDMPFGLLIDPTGRFLFVASNSGGFAYTRNGQTGALTAVAGNPFPGVSGASVITPRAVGGFFASSAAFIYYPVYFQTIGFSVAGFEIASSGALTSLGSLTSATPTGPTPFAAMSPTGDNLYLAEPGVPTYSIDATTGALTPTTPPAGPATWTGITLNRAGTTLYATDGAQVWAYSVNGATGALTPIAGSPFSAASTTDFITVGSSLITFDAGGKFLYVGNRSAEVISGFAVDPVSGALTPAPGSPFSASGTSLAVIVSTPIP